MGIAKCPSSAFDSARFARLIQKECGANLPTKNMVVIFVSLIGVLMKNQIIWVITPCQLVNSYQCH